MLDLNALRTLLNRHGQALEYPVRGFDIAGRVFDFNRRRALMGVVNLSPDSWYHESVCRTEGEAVARGLALAREGADLVDVGAESTLPNAARVAPQEQSDRLVPIVRALAAQGVIVSVESYHPQVLEACGQAGARVFNLTGLKDGQEVFKLARRFEAALVLCYVQGQTVRQVGDFEFAPDMTAELEAYFQQHLARAEALGVRRCIVDPGLGFYYRNLEDGNLRVNYQMHTFLNSFRLARLGYPVMNILPHAPEIFGPEQRRAAEPFFAVLALLGGTHVVRTHELPVVARIRAVMELFRAERGEGPGRLP
ncbi:MAG TPA: dihydropteroate synthase [bacterium]|nr:dihydropteroate synthase [bacterium]